MSDNSTMVQFTRREYRLLRAVEPCLYHRRRNLYDDLTVHQMRQTYCESVMTLILFIQVLVLCFTFVWIFTSVHSYPELAIVFCTVGSFGITWLPQVIYDLLVCRAYYRHKRTRGQCAKIKLNNHLHGLGESSGFPSS